MNENFNFDTSNSLMSKFRLVIKNIPKTLPDSHVKDILSKNFGSNIFDVVISKSLHKSKNNKICYVSVDSIERRKEIINFFSTFELVDPKGFKQKLNVVDCLYQEDYTNKLDPIENTIDQSKLYK